MVRKAIARTMTVTNQTKLRALRKEAKGQKGPKALFVRAKLTRRARRSLTRSQLRQKTKKESKRRANFPPRKFAFVA